MWCILSQIVNNYATTKRFPKVINAKLELNNWQCLQTKLERHSNKSVLFGKFFVKLLATFTSKSRKHNFRKACLCLLPLVAFHSQRRLFPSLFPPATSNLKQKGRTGTENGTKAARWRNPRPKSHLGWFFLVFGEGKATKENISIFWFIWPLKLTFTY